MGGWSVRTVGGCAQSTGVSECTFRRAAVVNATGCSPQRAPARARRAPCCRRASPGLPPSDEAYRPSRPRPLALTPARRSSCASSASSAFTWGFWDAHYQGLGFQPARTLAVSSYSNAGPGTRRERAAGGCGARTHARARERGRRRARGRPTWRSSESSSSGARAASIFTWGRKQTAVNKQKGPRASRAVCGEAGSSCKSRGARARPLRALPARANVHRPPADHPQRPRAAYLRLGLVQAVCTPRRLDRSPKPLPQDRTALTTLARKSPAPRPRPGSRWPCQAGGGC